MAPRLRRLFDVVTHYKSPHSLHTFSRRGCTLKGQAGHADKSVRSYSGQSALAAGLAVPAPHNFSNTALCFRSPGSPPRAARVHRRHGPGRDPRELAPIIGEFGHEASAHATTLNCRAQMGVLLGPAGPAPSRLLVRLAKRPVERSGQRATVGRATLGRGPALREVWGSPARRRH